MTDIRKLIEARAASDPRLKAVLKKIKEGTATFKDTAYYAEVYSSITGKVFSANVLDLVGTEREEVCEELLRGNYEEINNICAQVQTALDEAAGIHIKPQRAAFPTDRVDQIAHSLLDPTVKDSVIKRRANTGVANVSQGFHDSYIKVNASFRNDAGLKVYINRETDGKCCEWCTKIAGRYSYGTEPDDIYRRHDNCGCTVTYENGKQRQDVWSKRSWTSPEVGAGAPPPTRFTPEQAAEIQARNMPQGLTNRRRNGIIEEKEELPRKIKSGSNTVDWSIVQSEEYSKKYMKLSDDERVSSAIETRAKWALNNRDGKNTEELYAISLKDGREVSRITDQNYDSAVKRTSKFTRELNAADESGEEILLLHNHPRGLPPSISDINALLKNKNVSGITVGHNGSIYRYTRPNKEIPKSDWSIALRRHKKYSDITSMEKALSDLSKEFGFEFEIL